MVGRRAFAGIRRPGRPAVGWLLSLPLATACVDALPDRQLIVEARVLAVRPRVIDTSWPGDAPESRAEVLPLERVRLETLFVDPRGAFEGAAAVDFAPIWIACQLPPGTGLIGCISDAAPFEPDALPPCPSPQLADLAALQAGLDPAILPAPVSPCRLPDGPSPEFTVPLDAGIAAGAQVELTVVGQAADPTAREHDSEACATRLARGDTQLPNDCVYGTYRLDVASPEVWGAALRDGPEALEPLDTHPRITRFRAIRRDAAGQLVGPAQGVAVARGDRVAVREGDTLRIEVTTPEADLQAYEIPVNDGGTTRPGREELAGDWFRTWGRQLADDSSDPESFNAWTARPGDQDETTRPPDDLAHLVYVVRDGRAGVNWWWFSIEVQP